MSQSTYTQHLSQTAPVPATEPLEGQVANNGGGYSYAVDLWTRVRRFLILGAEGGNYYTGERKLVLSNAKAVQEAAEADPARLASIIAEVSDGGLAPKNDPAIFALALLAANKDPKKRKFAYDIVSKVCRTSTHLFDFMGAIKSLRGSSTGLRKAVAKWYQGKAGERLELQVVKYRQRNGWTHRDVLRVNHVKHWDAQTETLFKYVLARDAGAVGSILPAPEYFNQGLTIVGQFLRMNEQFAAEPTNFKAIAKLLSASDNKLTWEMLPTETLKSPDVWRALLPDMGLTALIRNLGRMTANGVFGAGSVLENATQTVVKKLTDRALVEKSRIHPISVLLALGTYSNGKGEKGKLTWQPVTAIRQALSDCFYLAFKNVEPTGKNYLVGLDVSGSMSSPINGSTILTHAQAAGAMATVLKRSEPWVEVLGFSTNLVDLKLRRDETLDGFCQRIRGMTFGTTNPGALIEHATKAKLPVDVFVIITDCEVNHGQHPKTALAKYRKTVNPKAKFVILGTEANEFTLADPSDRNSLDVAGFDASFPQILAAFATDRL